MAAEDTIDPVELATELTIAWLGNQHKRVTADEVPSFLTSMHKAVIELTGRASVLSGDATSGEAVETHSAAVSVRKSLGSKDHIISMIDGRPYRALRRHLSKHGLTPAQYRERYNLKSDYPMVAETYSAARREMAKKIGLGNKRLGVEKEAAPSAPPATKRSRKKTDLA